MMTRLGTSVGGGKVNAVFRRMNLFAEHHAQDVVLLTIEHSVNAKIAFAKLQKDGILHPRVLHKSLFEFCLPSKVVPSPWKPAALPKWNQQIAKGRKKKRISYYFEDAMVMRDTLETTAAGLLTVRQIFSDPEKEIRLKYLDDTLIEGVARFGDGFVHKTLYVDEKSVCQIRYENRSFRFTDNAVTGKRYFNEVLMQKELVSQAFPKNCLVFVDGITTVYLSQHIDAKKVLFLHADHRSPAGQVLRRPRYMVEHFQGDAIVTATQVHKERLETDLQPACRIDVIPHYADAPQKAPDPRRHICTVSRLRLIDKPIHNCIAAFSRVMHLIPDCNYLIYGSGPDQARLSQLIDHLQCSKRVFLMGHTSEPDRVFRNSLLSLAPTMTEGFGLALLESMTNGCPVISYDVDYGPRELVEPGDNGELVPPGDVDAIAAAILRVYADQPRYSERSLERVKHYSFENYRQNYLSLVEEIVGRSRFFDISSGDLRSEVMTALTYAPKPHRASLVSLYISLSISDRDLEGAYWGFGQKRTLFPNAPRPLMRCIWLSRRLGRMDACLDHLAEFESAFPSQYREFLAQNPEFEALIESN